MINLLYDFLQYSKDINYRSSDTLNHYKYDTLNFIEYVKFKKQKLNVNIEEILITDCIERLETYKENRKVSRNTLSILSNSIRQYFRYCAMIWKKLQFNIEQIPIIKKERKPYDMMKKDEYETFIEAPLLLEQTPIIAERNQLLIEVPYRTWLRRSEILRCKFADFHNENRQFMLEWKGGYYDRVFFTEDLRKKVLQFEENLKEYIKNRPFELEYVFVGLDNKNRWKPLNPCHVNTIFRKYSNNLIEAGKITRNLHPHMERHSFATNCVYSWLSQQATTRLMRHRDPKTTENYYHMNDTRLKSEFDKIS